MTMTDPLRRAGLDRRAFLRGFTGCCLAASPLLTPMTLASAPSENRLVVIVLRGAMDGLDVLRPVGDPAYAALRPGLASGAEALPLDGFYALHPGLTDLLPLWQAGQLGFAHAVSTPYRDKRSHFEGQDILEAGLPAMTGQGARDSGWLNRLAGLMPGATARTTFDIGREPDLILRGPAPASTWYPQPQPGLSSQARRLADMVFHEDPLFRDQAAAMFDLAEEEAGGTDRSQPQHLQVADYLAAQLAAETRLAAFSITGWDTHGGQKVALKRPLKELSETILRLRQQLGPVWDRTAILALTEFGRTARENGSGGTDHGTGGAMLMAGGAVRGGRVFADWPGLEEASLYDRRDLQPTRDVRALAAGAIRTLYGTAAGDLEARVFPGLDMAGTPQIVL
ncbi:DUF1501 domain-containing protein [Mangrovicoccus sp. HB182678]|uniref:DUF1501 domain-containing protein n=2 Tax=Mangrovicoccus algicola TaxID=2771008 RepID=A0A8J6YYZ0_9RHOB|nr:DUF1501 domain-containing protein [Mangrovicoccus algicola]MBE3640592.1 DUF1501 domain-containing protein [Mangrovicoccus algicola]